MFVVVRSFIVLLFLFSFSYMNFVLPLFYIFTSVSWLFMFFFFFYNHFNITWNILKIFPNHQIGPPPPPPPPFVFHGGGLADLPEHERTQYSPVPTRYMYLISRKLTQTHIHPHTYTQLYTRQIILEMFFFFKKIYFVFFCICFK